jgi:hypothetical protein
MVDAVTLADCLAQPGRHGNMGQLDRHLTCGARDALVRAMPLSVQLGQLDLVVGRPPTTQPAKPRT